jgi:PBSX family phage terminase large subunit
MNGPVAILDERRAPFEPRGSAEALLYSHAPEILACGPAGTGKSRACLEKLHICCEKYPGMRALICRKTRESLSETALVTFENKVLPVGHYLMRGAKRSHRQSYRYKNGSEIIVCGLDKSEKIMSSEFDLAYIQEAIECEENDWENVTSRLRHGKMGWHQLIADTNPSFPGHWLKKRCDRGQTTLLESKHQDNPAYFDPAKKRWTDLGRMYLETLQALTGHRRARLLSGLWVAAEGSRFPMFDGTPGKIHVFRMADRFPQGIPPTWRLILGIDYGKAAPYCCLWISIDFNGDVYVYREDYEAQLSPWTQGERIVNLTKETEIVDVAYADPAAWSSPANLDPNKAKEPSPASYWEAKMAKDPAKRFGPLRPGFNRSRTAALETIERFLEHGNGFADLYIEEGCENLINELAGAVWDKSGTKEDIDPSCPDHAITSLYYAIHTDADAPKAPKRPPTMEEMRAAMEAARVAQSERNFLKQSKKLRL